MKIDYTFHFEEGSSGSKIEINKLSDILSKDFWRNYFKEKILEQNEELSNSLKGINKDSYSFYTITSSSHSIHFNTMMYKYLFIGMGDIYIPEIHNTDFLIKFYTTKDKEKLLSNIHFNIYNSEFDFRIEKRRMISKMFILNEDIKHNELLSKITDGNHHFIKPPKRHKRFARNNHKEYNLKMNNWFKVKQLSDYHLNYLNDYLKSENHILNIRSLLEENYISENFDKYNDILRKLPLKKSVKVKNNSGKKIKISKIDNFYPIDFNYASRDGFLVVFDKRNSVYYDAKGFVYLKIEDKDYVYSIYNWGQFVDIIDNFELLKTKVNEFPKYQVADNKYKKKIKKHIKKFFN